MDNQLTIIDQAKKGLAEIQNLKAQIDEIGLNCQQISIKDDLSLAIAQQNLSKANNMSTLIDSKISDLKDPYWEACKLIDSLKKDLKFELSAGISHIKLEVSSWEKAKQAEIKKKADELAVKLEFNQITPEIAAEQAKALQESASLNKTKNIRWKWTAELADITQVPKEWLVVELNQELVKEYMKENKDKLKDGEIIQGVRFTKEMIVTA